MPIPALRRVILGALVAAFSITGLTAIPAQAADGGDARACVTKREYNSAMAGWSQARIANWFDTAGTQIGAFNEWVDDGYWDYEDVWVDDGYWEYDEFTGEDVWVEDGYWDYQEVWVEDWRNEKDSVRRYRKCRSWGSGYVGVNFDNYSFRDEGLYGMRAYAARPNRPYLLKWWIYGDGFMRTNGSSVPDKARVLPQGHGTF